MYSFVNLIPTAEGGTHVAGFRAALTRAVNEAAKTEKLLKAGEGNILGDDLREGLLCVLSVKLPNPQFEGQTKGKLGNGETTGAVSTLVYASSPTSSRTRAGGSSGSSSTRRSPRGGRGRPPSGRRSWSGARGAAEGTQGFPESSPTVSRGSPQRRSSSSSRATAPAAARSRGGTGSFRPSSLCEGRFSTSRRRVWIRYSRTPRSAILKALGCGVGAVRRLRLRWKIVIPTPT